MSLDLLLDRARAAPRRLLLAGGNGGRLAAPVARLRSAGFDGVTAVGAGGIAPERHPRHEEVAQLLRARDPDRVRDAIHALDLAAEPLLFALGLVALGEADGVLAGPGLGAPQLADLTRWVLGAPADGGSIRSASWLLLANGGLVGFADCHLPEPLSAASRARVARLASEAHARLAGEPGRVTFLPGAGAGGTIPDPVLVEAVAALRLQAPGTEAETDVGALFRGRANVLIFPGGTAAYLAIQTARALAGARLLGPFLLGPPGTAAGVSDDASEDEVVGTAAATVLIAGGPAA